jgi:hypothetical protein
MADYVKSRLAKAGEKLRTQHFPPGTSRICCAGRCHYGGSRSFGNGACLRNGDKVQPARFVRMERDSGQSHDGHLSASR